MDTVDAVLEGKPMRCNLPHASLSLPWSVTAPSCYRATVFIPSTFLIPSRKIQLELPLARELIDERYDRLLYGIKYAPPYDGGALDV